MAPPAPMVSQKRERATTLPSRLRSQIKITFDCQASNSETCLTLPHRSITRWELDAHQQYWREAGPGTAEERCGRPAEHHHRIRAPRGVKARFSVRPHHIDCRATGEAVLAQEQQRR